MKKPLIKLSILNILVAIILYYAYMYTAFMSGYGANNNHLQEEEKMFVGFVISHFLINLFLLYKYHKFNSVFVSISMVLIAIYYFVEGWQFGYFI